MRTRFRPSGATHSRSFSAPTVPGLKLTPPTPHQTFHQHDKDDYDSDDSIPTSAAAMPRPNRYRRPNPRTSGHPYATTASTTTTTTAQPASPSPPFALDQYQSINPGFFRGNLRNETVAAFSVVLAPDRKTVTIQGQLIPKPPKYPPHQDVRQDWRSLSQPTSPLFFQDPIDPAIAALGLHKEPSPPTTTTTTTTTTEKDTVSPLLQQRCTGALPGKEVSISPLAEGSPGHISQIYVEQYNAYMAQYQAEQQMPLWPSQQLQDSHG